MGTIFMGLQAFSFFNFLSRSDRFFPVTLGVLALNIVTHLRPSGLNVVWPSLKQACISVQSVCYSRDWKRIFMSPFFHSGNNHLYYNMASFVWKAVTLERYFGSFYFMYMVAVFSVATGLLYLALSYVLAEVLDQLSMVQSCAVGFSGVIFALKVVTTHIQPNSMTMVMGMFPVPTRLACWAELVLISVIFPNVSFVGHLSGILVGLAFVWGPLKNVMDTPLYMVDFVTGREICIAINHVIRVQYNKIIARHCIIIIIDNHMQRNNSYTYRAAPTGIICYNNKRNLAGSLIIRASRILLL